MDLRIALWAVVIAVLMPRTVAAEWLIAKWQVFENVSFAAQRLDDGRISVQLMGPALNTPPPNSTGTGTPLDKRTTDVWVLLRDGTAAKQREKPTRPISIGFCNAGECIAIRSYGFDAVADSDIAGFVVSVGGRFFAKEFEK